VKNPWTGRESEADEPYLNEYKDISGQVEKASVMRDAARGHTVPTFLKITGMVARSLFLVALMVATALISLPATISASRLAHFSSADFLRAGIGLLVCLCVAVQLFRRPKDNDGYRVWTFIGLAAAAVLVFVMALKIAFPALV
jgi:hypothetical protein